METKVCSRCHKELPKTEEYFYKHIRAKDGFNASCKECRKNPPPIIKEAPEGYRKCHRCGEILLENEDNFYVSKTRLGKPYFQSHCKICVLSYHQEHYLLNQDDIKAYQREYKNTHEDKIKKRNKRHYEENKVEISVKAKIYRAKRKDKRNLSDRDRRKVDPEFKILDGLRSSLNKALKHGGEKHAKAVVLLGCTIPEFKLYLESLWLPGMNWSNKSRWGWHIDHIKPCASFDLTDPEQQRICFHYTNMQPLWAYDNLSKNSFYNGTRHGYKKRGIISPS